MSLDLIKGTSQKEKEQKVHFLTLASFLDQYQISERYFRVHNAINNSNWMGLLGNGGKWDTDKLGDLLGEFQRLSLIQSFEHATLKVIELTNLLGAFLGTHDVNHLKSARRQLVMLCNAWVEANENILHDSYKTAVTTHRESQGLYEEAEQLYGRAPRTAHWSGIIKCARTVDNRYMIYMYQRQKDK
ncbi:hypothetical protein V8E54_003308 [Elaphomyces granulatus]